MTALILAFQATIWLVIGYLFVLSRNASIFHPFSFYLAFHGIAFVIRPIMEHAFGFEHVFFRMMFYPTDDQIQAALLITSTAFLVFATVTWAFDTVTARVSRPNPNGFNSSEWPIFLSVAALITPIALYSVIISIQD